MNQTAQIERMPLHRIEIDSRDRGVLFTLGKRLRSYFSRMGQERSVSIKRDCVEVRGDISSGALEKMAAAVLTAQRKVRSYSIKSYEDFGEKYQRRHLNEDD